MMELFILQGEGTPIHSVREVFLFLRGSAREASTDHIVLAGVINLALPINLLDGLRWGGGVYCFLVHLFGRFLPFLFSFPSNSQLIVGFSSFGSFALSFLWVSSSISHCFSDSILAPPHEIVGGCWYIAIDTLSTLLGSLFYSYPSCHHDDSRSPTGMSKKIQKAIQMS